jgi:hypothetical protein
MRDKLEGDRSEGNLSFYGLLSSE